MVTCAGLVVYMNFSTCTVNGFLLSECQQSIWKNKIMFSARNACLYKEAGLCN